HNEKRLLREFEDGAAPPSVDLVQCITCKRTFLPDIWKKHTNFCLMSKAKKKYVFDSRSQRTRGTEFSVLEPTQPKAEPPKKPSNWRKNHKDLISSVRAAKILTTAMKDGTSLPPPPPHPYVADRHIKICNNGTAPLPLDLVQEIRRFHGLTSPPSGASTCVKPGTWCSQPSFSANMG
uniref:Zinc finger C2HC domain-containing protein 1A n=1 Tax=Gouania willdenowi TaxID=441366 RepID=A0A8C5GI13_GOUWI